MCTLLHCLLSAHWSDLESLKLTAKFHFHLLSKLYLALDYRWHYSTAKHHCPQQVDVMKGYRRTLEELFNKTKMINYTSLRTTTVFEVRDMFGLVFLSNKE